METREIVAWSIAAFALIGAGASVAMRTTAPPNVSRIAMEHNRLSEENRRLRSTLVGLRGEQVAMRAELDRLLERVRSGSVGGSVPAAGGIAASPGSEPEDEARVRGRVTDITAELSRLSGEMAAGNAESMKSLFARISQLQAMGPEALPALKDAFRSSNDPAVKRIITTILAARGGEDEQKFLLEAAERESDPEVKQALLSNVSMMSESGRAAAQEKIKDLVSAPEASVRAGAIHGFMSLDDPQVAAAVERALGEDTSETVRLAALDALMRDPSRRDEALRLAANDRSERIRGIAECRARLDDLQSAITE